MAVTDVIDSIAICRLPMMSASVQRIHRRRFQTSPVTESVGFVTSKTHNHGQHTITITSNERKERKKSETERRLKKRILIGIASLLCCVPSTEQRTATQAGRSAGTAQFRFRAVSSQQPTVRVGERETAADS